MERFISDQCGSNWRDLSYPVKLRKLTAPQLPSGWLCGPMKWSSGDTTTLTSVYTIYNYSNAFGSRFAPYCSVEAWKTRYRMTLQDLRQFSVRKTENSVILSVEEGENSYTGNISYSFSTPLPEGRTIPWGVSATYDMFAKGECQYVISATTVCPAWIYSESMEVSREMNQCFRVSIESMSGTGGRHVL